MKFLQIGDLHLGKKLYEFSLYDDQVFMLEKIIEILQKDNFDALLITGDIYEQSMPSQDAINLFGGFLEKIHATLPELSVFIISGNHDSSARLSYASEILKTQNIFIQTNFDETSEPIIFKAGDEECAIFMLPFLQQSVSKKTKANLSQVEIITEAALYLKEKLKTSMPNILLAHLFTLPENKNSKVEKFSENENDNMIIDEYRGSVQFVSPSVFNFFDYVALGHLHSFLKITDRMYYSGSPFAYSFDEVKTNEYEKFALAVEINCNEKDSLPNVNKIKIPQLHRLQILSGEFSEFISTDKFNSYAKDYLQIELINSNAVESAMQLLQKKFPLTMHIKQKSFEVLSSNKKNNFIVEKIISENDFENIFKMFIRDIGEETNDEEINLAKTFWEMEDKE
ncbi:MAG: exonuclease subunit SbcD [Treponemataceae bacterium]